MTRRRVLALLAALGFAAAASGCAGRLAHSIGEDSAHDARGGHGGGHAEIPPGEFVADSIFHLESEWVNPDGEKRPLAQALSGGPTAAAMIYTSCEHACPVIVSDMLKIRQGLGDDSPGARFVLFSFDPERDTPARMRNYRGEQNLNQWTILAPASPGAERELAAALGVRFKPIPGGDFAHSNIIFILDADGVPRHRQVGLMQAPDESVSVLRRLLKK